MTVDPSPVAADAAALDLVEQNRLDFVARLNRIINPLAGRTDLLLECIWNAETDGAQPQAPAWFEPAACRVTLNAPAVLGDTDPAAVNPLTAAGRRQHPSVVGVCAHEAAHARSTQWPDDMSGQAPPGVVQAAVLLEEPRIEGRHILRRPQDRPFLRAATRTFNLAPLEASGAPDRWRAATAAALTSARRDAGVLTAQDLAPVEPLLRDELGEDYDTLRSLWQTALALPDGDVDGLLAVATQWVDVVGPMPDATGPASIGCASTVTGDPRDTVPAESEWEDDSAPYDGATDTDTEEELDDLLSALVESLNGAAERGSAEARATPTPAATPEEMAEAAQRDNDVKRHHVAKKTASEVFSESGATNVVRHRSPTDDDRRLARQIGQALRRAQFRDRAVTATASEVPPGRLNGRDAMLGRAQRSMGVPVTAKPFTSVRRRRVPEPPMTLGVMIDVSGSMRWATKIMSTTVWAFAHAIRETHGRFAAVTFGLGHVEPLIHPGIVPADVPQFTARGNDETFGAAFDALDGALRLTVGDGARLLVVVSDAHYYGAEVANAERATNTMRRHGGHVLWINSEQTMTIPDQALKLMIGDDASQIPGLITRELAAALRQ